MDRLLKTRVMKKLLIYFQILTLFSTHLAYADESANTARLSEAAVAEVTPMPENYKLPRGLMLDSVVFFNRYKDQQGRRVDVKGFNGRFGATWGEDFRRKVFEIEQQHNSKVELIYTLTSTMEDAKTLQKRMALVGREMAIIEIPDWVQEHVLERAAAESAGGLKELWYETKEVAGKLLHPIKTVTDAQKILRNQFVKPSPEDIRIAAISTSISAATTLAFSIGIDWRFAVAMTAARALFSGTNAVFRSTLNNLFRANLLDETRLISTGRRTAARLLTFGVGIGQTYYSIGTNYFSEFYALSQSQLLSHTVTSGVVESLSSEERNNRLSEKANRNMQFNTFLVGSMIGALATVGTVGPMVWEYGFLNVSALQTASIAIFSSLFLAYKYYSDNVEKMAQKSLREYFDERYRKFKSLRRLKVERERQERLDLELALSRRNELLKDAREHGRQRQFRQTTSGAACRLLFN